MCPLYCSYFTNQTVNQTIEPNKRHIKNHPSCGPFNPFCNRKTRELLKGGKGKWLEVDTMQADGIRRRYINTSVCIRPARRTVKNISVNQWTNRNQCIKYTHEKHDMKHRFRPENGSSTKLRNFPMSEYEKDWVVYNTLLSMLTSITTCPTTKTDTYGCLINVKIDNSRCISPLVISRRPRRTDS